MALGTRLVYYPVCILLTVCVTFCIGNQCPEPTSLPCNVTVRCDCCLEGTCMSETNDWCYPAYCKNGYRGAKCILSCPEACKCCDQNYAPNYNCNECKPGYYGKNCSSNCSIGCMICDKTHGGCLQCKDGHYGDNCGMKCPENCGNQSCDISTGACDKCNGAFYGLHCNKSCPQNCNSTDCHKETGHCLSCKTGYFGILCDGQCPDQCFSNMCSDEGDCSACEQRYHGSKCNDTCPLSCNNSICHMNDGSCSQGCIPYFEGKFCNSCVIGKYGDACNKACSQNCVDNECQRVDGACSSGCEGDFSDKQFCCVDNQNCEKCSSYTSCTTCKNGTYGIFCEYNCSVNCYDTCEKTTGHCIQCKRNKYGPQCENDCSDNCVQSGNLENSSCLRNNGSCIFGCKSGFYGEKCESECSPACNETCRRRDGKCDSCKENTFGFNCAHNCSMNCLQPNDQIHLCFRDNGTCIFGCRSSYFGTNCTKKCPEFCNGTCYQDTGQCDGGCALNHFGLYCENKCSTGCNETDSDVARCHDTNGSCIFGCDDGYAGDNCTQTPTEDGIKEGFPMAVVVVPIVTVIAVAAVAVVIIIIIRKRTSKQKTSDGSDNKETDNHTLRPEYENTAFSAPHHSEEDELEEGPPVIMPKSVDRNPIYANTTKPQTQLSKPNLMKFLSKSDEEFKQEFEQQMSPLIRKRALYMCEDIQFLPIGLIKSFTEATKSGNGKKNRYKNIFPYDDSRVKVAGADSDYINASYINGYKKKCAYIAAQGPTKKNMGADFAIFWKMVWQEKVETIVMVTKLHEITGSKCDQYWPSLGSSSKHAEFEVHCAKEEVFAEFVVRSLTITKGDDTRHINHVNFTAWPDKGVPHDVISIINLRHKVNKMKKMFKESPLLVHCSAGIGRTGTYIALDILTQQGSVEDQIYVFECVVDMRQNRPNMVQTQEQYQFLHHAVLWTLTSDIEPLPSERFIDRSWLDDNTLAEMLSQLQLPNFYDNEEERQAIDDNKTISFTNRKDADIPGRRHGVSLLMNEMANKSSYINAVSIDGYKTKNRFIAAMTPLPETKTDFLGMILQEEVACIVDLTPLDSDKQDIGEYLPADNDTIQYESHVFKITARETHGCYVKTEIDIADNAKGEDGDHRTLHHYLFSKWDAGAALPSSSDFVTLVNAVDEATIKMDITGPIVVHCLSGAKRSGLFCAVWLLIERMTIDRSVSVLNTLRQVKTRRRGAFPDKGQIGLCFECVDHHLRYLSERIYSNTALQSDGRGLDNV